MRRGTLRGIKELLSLFCSNFSTFCVYIFFKSYCQKDRGKKTKPTGVLSHTNLTDKISMWELEDADSNFGSQLHHVNSSKSLKFSSSPEIIIVTLCITVRLPSEKDYVVTHDCLIDYVVTHDCLISSIDKVLLISEMHFGLI